MARYVALLRAVNVAGHARLPAADLAKLFTAAGAADVSTFGHAGNVLFTTSRGAAKLVARVREAIADGYGERPVIVLRTSSELFDLMTAQPFDGCGAAPADKLYVTFLARKPLRPPLLPLSSAPERLTAFEQRGREILVVSGPKANGFYGFPNAFVETAFGVAATTRNWSTVTRLAALLAR
jgi:uncharacterized protein (DUF1697 family)